MPILFISARTSDDDILTALNIGGDDYIKKPYTMSILLAKVKAVLTRYEKAAEAAKTASSKGVSDQAMTGQIKVSEGILLNAGTHLLIRENKTIPLKAMEYKMLLYLLENRGRVVTKEEFLSNVWEDSFIGEGTLPVHIRHLREKIEINPNEPQIIRTVWGVGYIIRSAEE